MTKIDNLKKITGVSHFYMPTPKLVLLGGVIALLILVLGGFVGKSFVDNRREILLDDLKQRLEILAKGRADVVDTWLEGLKVTGSHITDADVVRLYASEVSIAHGEGKSEKESLHEALLAQKPYMEHTMREYVRQNNLVQAMMVSDKGQVFLSSMEGLKLSDAQMKTMVKVLEHKKVEVRPVQVSSGQLLLDVFRPVFVMSDNEKDMAVSAVLLSTFKISKPLEELLSADLLSKDGEHISLLQQNESHYENILLGAMPALQNVQQETLKPFWMGEQVHLNVHPSPVHENPVFGVAVDVPSSPFVVLHEYDKNQAVLPLAVYAQNVYTVTLTVCSTLMACFAAWLVYVVGTRNRRRVLMQQQSMDALVRAVELRDPYLAGHSSRTAKMALKLANEMDLNVSERSTLYYAAMLSGVGKISVPRAILTKQAKLTAKEKKELHDHVNHAMTVLEGVDFGLPVADVIYQMYERLDGSGYPNKFEGKDINELSRILTIADVYCALVEPRAYRDGLSSEKALQHFEKEMKKYDAQIVEVLKKVVE